MRRNHSYMAVQMYTINKHCKPFTHHSRNKSGKCIPDTTYIVEYSTNFGWFLLFMAINCSWAQQNNKQGLWHNSEFVECDKQKDLPSGCSHSWGTVPPGNRHPTHRETCFAGIMRQLAHQHHSRWWSRYQLNRKCKWCRCEGSIRPHSKNTWGLARTWKTWVESQLNRESTIPERKIPDFATHPLEPETNGRSNIALQLD